MDQARSAGCDANGLQGHPIYHRKRDSIEAHQTIVFAALAASRWIEGQDRLVNYHQQPSGRTRPSGTVPALVAA